MGLALLDKGTYTTHPVVLVLFRVNNRELEDKFIFVTKQPDASSAMELNIHNPLASESYTVYSRVSHGNESMEMCDSYLATS